MSHSWLAPGHIWRRVDSVLRPDIIIIDLFPNSLSFCQYYCLFSWVFLPLTCSHLSCSSLILICCCLELFLSILPCLHVCTPDRMSQLKLLAYNDYLTIRAWNDFRKLYIYSIPTLHSRFEVKISMQQSKPYYWSRRHWNLKGAQKEGNGAFKK